MAGSQPVQADADATIRVARPVPTAAPPVRERAVDGALGLYGGEDLAAFLAEPAALAALESWFGRDRLAGYVERGRWEEVAAALDRDICRLDHLLSRQLDVVLHHPRLQAMEARWRGVAYLVSQTGGGEDNVLVRLLNVSWNELCADFDRAADFDQSLLFDKIYSEEFGMPGGRPFGLLVVDHLCRHRRLPGDSCDDVSGLRSLAQVAAASFAPAVTGAHPSLLGLESFAELGRPVNLAGIFQADEYARWRGLQDAEDSRYVGVVLPGILLRPPWAGAETRGEGFRHSEGTLFHDDYLWGNGAFAFAAVIIQAFREHGWFADIRGARPDSDGAGLVWALPAPAFPTDGWAAARRRPVEVDLTDGQSQELGNLGLIPVSPCRHTGRLVFLGNQSFQRLPDYEGIALVNARLAGMLQYVLCVSRFSHYIKVMARDRLGGFTNAEQLERYLDDWLRGYSLGNDDASYEQKARCPLRGSSVRISEIPGRVGVLSCVIHLQPHFQLDQVVTGVRLRTELAAPKPH